MTNERSSTSNSRINNLYYSKAIIPYELVEKPRSPKLAPRAKLHAKHEKYILGRNGQLVS